MSTRAAASDLTLITDMISCYPPTSPKLISYAAGLISWQGLTLVLELPDLKTDIGWPSPASNY